MGASYCDWAFFPAHVVDLMLIKLDRLSDYVCFCGVCPQWRKNALEVDVDHKVNLDVLKGSRKKLPLLIFKTDEKSDKWMDLYNVNNEITYLLKLPLPYRHRFIGCSFGWLFCIQETMVVTLMNPFNNVSISLPVFIDPCELFWKVWRRRYFDLYIKKGILSSDPHASPDNFVVVVIYDVMGKLAFFKSGEPSWNFIDSDMLLCDIMFYQGKLYGISIRGKFVHIDLDSKTIRIILPSTDFGVNGIYLVESQDGELLMVKRRWFEDRYYGEDPNGEANNPDNEEGSDNEENYDYEESTESSDNEDHGLGPVCYSNGENAGSDSEAESLDTRCPVNTIREKFSALDGHPRTFEFMVFKMTQPIEEESASWVRIKNIGEKALFLGDNHAVFVSSTEFPGCHPNCIYYTSEQHNTIPPYVYRGSNHDSGVFNLENKLFSDYHLLASPYEYLQPPIWFVPNPLDN